MWMYNACDNRVVSYYSIIYIWLEQFLKVYNVAIIFTQLVSSRDFQLEPYSINI